MFTEELFDKGVALANLNKFDEAIACFDEILKFNPKNADALYNTMKTAGTP